MTALLMLILAPVVGQAEPGERSQIDVLEKVRQHIKPLTHPLADRLPILTWQSRGFPTGLEDGRVGEVQQLLMDRGISTLCNPVASASRAEEYIPVLKYRQDHGLPVWGVCTLAMGRTPTTPRQREHKLQP